jgi:hypothetical protein
VFHLRVSSCHEEDEEKRKSSGERRILRDPRVDCCCVV